MDEGFAVADAAVAGAEDDGAAFDESAWAPSPPPLPHAVRVASRNSISIPDKRNLLFTIFLSRKTGRVRACRAGRRTVEEDNMLFPECPSGTYCCNPSPGLLKCDGSVVRRRLFVNGVIH